MEHCVFFSELAIWETLIWYDFFEKFEKHKNLQVEAHVRMQMIKQRITLEGEVEALHQYEMRVGEGANDERLDWVMNLCGVGPRQKFSRLLYAIDYDLQVVSCLALHSMSCDWQA